MSNNTNANEYTCRDCGCVFTSSDPFLYLDEPVCPDCEDDYVICNHCGEVIPVDFATYVNSAEGWYCEDCIDGLFVRCEDCGELFRPYRCFSGEDVYGDSVYICTDCYNDHWNTCDECGTLLNAYRDSVNEHEDCYYCDSCFDDLDTDDTPPAGRLHDYGYKPAPKFSRRKGEKEETALLFGLEVEMERGSEMAQTIIDMVDASNDLVYCKHDGSLVDGIELVTHPCTLDFHRYEMHWANICRVATKRGWKSHDTLHSGMHIHVGRAQLGDTPEARRENASKLVWLMDALWEPMKSFSRRRDGQLHWCDRNNAADSYGEDDIEKAFRTANCHGNRYHAVNLENMNTVEFRIFRGSLKRDTIIAAIELVSNMCKFVMAHTMDECKNANWLEVAQYERYKELDNYLAERGLLN